MILLVVAYIAHIHQKMAFSETLTYVISYWNGFVNNMTWKQIRLLADNYLDN